MKENACTLVCNVPYSLRNGNTYIRDYPLLSKPMKFPTNIEAIDLSWTWTVYPDYHWDGDELTFELPESAEAGWEYGRDYAPLRENTALFIEFSETPPTRAGILAFARRYGGLHHYVASETCPKCQHRFVFRSTKKEWVAAIGGMRDAIALWHAIEGGPAPSVKEVRITAFDGTGYSLNTAYYRLGDRGHQRYFSAGETRAELVSEFRRSLWVFTNDQLRKYATSAQLRLTNNCDYQLSFRPQSLLGAMWLQFAQAVARNYQIRICRGCGKPFQVGAGTNRRADATTCRDSCRQKAYRKENVSGKQR